jgi:hypothetical protein
MRTSPQLSSFLTFLHKWLFPALFLPCWPVWIWSAIRGPLVAWMGAILWGAACALLLIWTWPIKRVTIEGGFFTISNYITSYRVPVVHLSSITEHHSVQPPAITLYFEPPTPFGRRVRIIPPVGSFNNEGYDKVMTFLRGLLSDQERRLTKR